MTVLLLLLGKRHWGRLVSFKGEREGNLPHLWKESLDRDAPALTLGKPPYQPARKRKSWCQSPK